MNTFSRRRFLKRGGQTIAGAGLALGGNPLTSLAYGADTTLDSGNGYRALVCIYLSGGCDGFSLILPTDPYEHQVYSETRGNLAVGYDQLWELGGGGAPVGINRSAASLQPLYDDGKLTMIANVGTLIEPTSIEQFENKSVDLPAQLFSHNDQSIQWQQLQGRSSGVNGWGAKAADYLDAFQNSDYLTSVSLAGSNYWQTSTVRRPFTMNQEGVHAYQGMDLASSWTQPRAEAFSRVVDLPRSHVLTRAYADLQRRAMSITADLGQVLESNAGLFADTPEDNPLAAQLGMVAQLIAAQDTLGLRRQIFYVGMDGFDVHDNQNKEHPELFAQLATAMSYFQGKIDELGQSNNVTTFTASDFGRSLLSNGDGTDHGWGNHMMAMGGAVQGGRIVGELPSLDINGPNSIHRGRILPTLSAAQYAGTLLDWLGLDENQVNQVLPNLRNFDTRNLGFLG